MMRFFYTPRWLQALQPQYVWRVKNSGSLPTPKRIFLTFDDGPIPDITPFVLDTLEKFEAKATFFCVGDNICKHPEVFQAVIAGGHSVGNHTFNHLNGWRTEEAIYEANIEQCAACLPAESNLFRPPYGKIKRNQLQRIQSQYKIIMWDVLSYDFDARLSPETCLQKTQKHTRDGSIVVFHDSIKAFQNLRYVLPRYMEWASAQGYSFASL